MISKFEWKENNAHVTFGGDLSFSDINQADEKIFNDLRFEMLTYVIFDFGNIQNITVTAEEANQIGLLDRSSGISNRNIKIGLVTTDLLLMELSQIYKDNLTGSNWTVGIFRNFESAQEWCTS